ncbi:FkbM family methyltransferase [Methylocella silvestris]|uniref:FkbM family methyltransferase n=1 Tax=Methylocella silvestris TaxID=199596 RepID=UPI0015E0EE82|nr:FkbM family methyltransferase [Methylocella silvestris]
MSVFKKLKELFILPFSRKAPTELLGEADQWAVLRNSINAQSFIISAGVGRSITFEEAIIEKFDATVILLDPSPTGVETMRKKTDKRNIDFLEMGLASQGGEISFGRPDRTDEGSFRKGGKEEGIVFECISLDELLAKYDKNKIDLLKIDVEGFEYEIIESIFEKKLDVEQICVEIHHNKVIAIDKTVADAALLIIKLFRHGYRVIYNRNMDFTFSKQQRLVGAN